MNFEIKKDANENKYIFLNDVKLGQGLICIYSKAKDELLVLDPDSKDYSGKDYTDKIKFDEKEYGIVQQIESKALLAMVELLKVVRTMG